MMSQGLVQWPPPRIWLAASCSLLISSMLIACHGSGTATNSAPSANNRRICLELDETRYSQPASHRENSVGGAEVSIDDETRMLRVHMSCAVDIQGSLTFEDRIFESDDSGKSWSAVMPSSLVMNEDMDVWPLPPTDHGFKYRTIAEAAASPYVDHLGMHQRKRWFIERSEDSGSCRPERSDSENTCSCRCSWECFQGRERTGVGHAGI